MSRSIGRPLDTRFIVGNGGAIIVAGLFVAGSAMWLGIVAAAGLIGNDGLVYRAGGEAILIGSDPWSASVHGYTFAGPPLTAYLFSPLALVPEVLFRVAWLVVCATSAAVIVRRLELPAYWLVYPPLVFGVVLGSPSIPGMALVLVGAPLIGLILRPHLALVTGWRTLLGFAIASVIAIVLHPEFVGEFGSIAARHVDETGGVINWWGSPLMLVTIVALASLRDRRALGWLIVPAIAPGIGWYGFAMVMPMRDLALALACAVPVPGVGAAAITAWAAWQVIRAKRVGDKPSIRG